VTQPLSTTIRDRVMDSPRYEFYGGTSVKCYHCSILGKPHILDFTGMDEHDEWHDGDGPPPLEFR
jgi:hypothetical protein